jgi:dTDP-4-dehydrorhamnose reductase
MRVLVTGAGGQVGREVVAWCEQAGDDVIAADHARLDVGDRDGVLAAVTTVRPDVVIHTAAWTAVDDCEGNPDRAFRVNALGARHVAEAASRTGAHVVHLSTDYVFSGKQAAAYCEWDEPDPQSVYGRSKLAGEREALALGAGATIVRTSWVCGDHGSNMVKTVLRLAGGGGPLAFVDDQRGQPTFAADLAPMLRRLAVERRAGIHHVTNQGAVSWFEFAREVLAAAALVVEVRPIRTEELHPPRAAPRPANSVLDNAALRLAGIPLLRDFRAPLADLVARLAG